MNVNPPREMRYKNEEESHVSHSHHKDSYSKGHCWNSKSNKRKRL